MGIKKMFYQKHCVQKTCLSVCLRFLCLFLSLPLYLCLSLSVSFSHSLQHTWSSILRARLIDLVHSVLGPRADSRAPNSKKLCSQMKYYYAEWSISLPLPFIWSVSLCCNLCLDLPVQLHLSRCHSWRGYQTCSIEKFIFSPEVNQHLVVNRHLGGTPKPTV